MPAGLVAHRKESPSACVDQVVDVPAGLVSDHGVLCKQFIRLNGESLLGAVNGLDVAISKGPSSILATSHRIVDVSVGWQQHYDPFRTVRKTEEDPQFRPSFQQRYEFM